MEELDLEALSTIEGGVDEDAALGFACGYALGIGLFAAGFLTGGAAWAVGAVIAGPACIAAGVGAATN